MLKLWVKIVESYCVNVKPDLQGSESELDRVKQISVIETIVFRFKIPSGIVRYRFREARK